MGMYLIKGDTLTNISKAIKTKLGKSATEKLKGKDFPTLIDSIKTHVDGSIPPVVLEEPSIRVDENGLITATANPSGTGYIQGGEKKNTLQLNTQEGTDITPSTENQIIPPLVYTTGIIRIKGDKDLKSENIALGVNLFGVEGGHKGLDEYLKFNRMNNVDRRTTERKVVNGVITALNVTPPAVATGKEIVFGAGISNDGASTFCKYCNHTSDQQYGHSFEPVGSASTTMRPTGILYSNTLVHMVGIPGTHFSCISEVKRFLGMEGNQYWRGYAKYPIRLNAVCKVGDNIWVFGQHDTYNNGGPCAAYGRVGDGVKTEMPLKWDKNMLPFVGGCSFNDIPVAICDTFVYYFTSGSDDTINGYSFISDGMIRFTTCKQLGDYLCIIGTSDDETYIYYTSDATGNIVELSRRKMMNGKFNVIGMTYIEGIYIIVGVDEHGVTKVWQTNNLVNGEEVCDPLLLDFGFTATAMDSYENCVYIASSNQSNTETNIIRIDMGNE